MAAWSDEQADLLKDFVTESSELLASAEELLIALEEDPGRSELVRSLMRCFHTIKGNSAYFGLKEISDLAHRLESLLGSVQPEAGPVEEGLFDELLQGVDRLQGLIRSAAVPLAQEAVEGEDDQDPATDRRRFLLFRSGDLEMALPMDKVEEVAKPAPVAKLPFVPAHIAGVINLRGSVLPLVDLERRLWGVDGLGQVQHLIVVPWGSGRVALGVRQVVGVAELQDVEPARTGRREWYGLEVLMHGDRPVALLDLERVLGRGAA